MSLNKEIGEDRKAQKFINGLYGFFVGGGEKVINGKR